MFDFDIKDTNSFVSETSSNKWLLTSCLITRVDVFGSETLVNEEHDTEKSVMNHPSAIIELYVICVSHTTLTNELLFL